MSLCSGAENNYAIITGYINSGMRFYALELLAITPNKVSW